MTHVAADILLEWISFTPVRRFLEDCDSALIEARRTLAALLVSACEESVRSHKISYAFNQF